MCVPCCMKTVNRHHAHERLHEENVVFEALGVNRNSAVWYRWGHENICAMAPIQLSGLFCMQCKGTYPIVGSPLHVVQRHLSNCRKPIARCAKVPIQLSEAHCTLCKGTYPIVRSALQIAIQRLHYAVNLTNQ